MPVRATWRPCRPRRLNAAPIDQPDATRRVGAVVALASGPFAQHQGVVLEIRGNRAVLAMLLFGELRQVSVDVSSLVARE